jgi:hypothetical protein
MERALFVVTEESGDREKIVPGERGAGKVSRHSRFSPARVCLRADARSG